MPEWRRALFSARRRGGPPRLAVGLLCEPAIVKILAEQPELPELVGDVLPDVRDHSVGSDDDFLPTFSLCALRLSTPRLCVLFSLCVLVDLHDPATCEPPFRLQEHRSLRLEDV